MKGWGSTVPSGDVTMGAGWRHRGGGWPMDESRPMRADELREVLRRALTPADLKRLSALSAPRAAASVLTTWALVVGILVVAVRYPHPAVWVAAAIALAAQQHALAILAHDAAHHRLFEHRR